MAVKGEWFTDDEEREDFPNVEFRHWNEEVGRQRRCDRRQSCPYIYLSTMIWKMRIWSIACF